MNIQIKLDTAEFEARMNASAREVVNALRSSVDKAARSARRDFIKSAAADIGVPASKIKKSTPPIRGTTQSNLSATFTVSKQNITPLEVGGSIASAEQRRKAGGTLTWLTLRLSGGQGASSPLSRSFTLAGRNSGKILVFHRSGPGKWGTLEGAKAIFAPHAASEMGVERLTPRRVWRETAERELNANLEQKIQQALNGSNVSPSGGSD